jgi:hypothetical protein
MAGLKRILSLLYKLVDKLNLMVNEKFDERMMKIRLKFKLQKFSLKNNKQSLFGIKMKNTLPLSSFPLHALLTIESYYTPVLSLAMFFILLYKTYNLPYTSGMSVQ